MKPIRTAIFGGSFNPIHRAHVHLAKLTLQQNMADEVWLMVSPQNPLKQNRQLLDQDTRLQLARLALQDEKQIKASDFEFQLPKPSYTWRTMELLAKKFPQRQFSLLIGADNWHAFPQWARHETLLSLYNIIIFPRKNYPVDPQTLPPGTQLLNAPLFPWSSTQIRQALAQGKDCSQMLHPEVLKQLLRQNPYSAED